MIRDALEVGNRERKGVSGFGNWEHVCRKYDEEHDVQMRELPCPCGSTCA